MPAIHAGMTLADGEQFSSEPGRVSDGDFFSQPRRTRNKEFLIKKFSDLGELGVSAVKSFSQEIRKYLL